MIEVSLGLWQFLLVFGVGLTLARRTMVFLPYGYRLAVSFGVGMSVFSIAYFVLGLVGGLRPGFLISLSILLTFPAAWTIYCESGPFSCAIWRAAKSSPFAFFLMGGLLLFYFLGACIPEREEDAIWYHLGVPVYYLYHGGLIQEVPFNLPSHYPMYGQLHYTLSLSVGNDSTAKVFAFCQFLPILLLIYSTLRRLGHHRAAMYGCILYLCCVHFRLPVMANVQRAVYFFAFLSTVMLWEALEKKSFRMLLISSFFCGMAMGTKLNALLFCYLLQVALILVWVIGASPGWRRSLVFLITHSGIAWLTLSPWMVKSSIITGNPLYPMLGGIFECHPRFRDAMEHTGNLHGIAVMKVSSLGEVFRQAAHNYTALISESDLLFSLGIVSLVFLPFLEWRKQKWIWATSLIACLFLTQIWGGATGRLFGINAAVLVTLIASTLSEVKARLSKSEGWLSRGLFPIMGILFVASFLFIKSSYLLSPNVNWFGDVVLQEQARRAWLIERGVRTEDSLEMEDWISANVSPEDEVYVAPLGYLSSLKRKFVASDKYFGEQFFHWVEEGTANDRLRELGVDWLLIDFIHDRGRNLGLQKYLADYWVPVKEMGTQVLYRNVATPPSAGRTAPRLENAHARFDGGLFG